MHLKLPRGTYKLTLTHEATGNVAFEHEGVDAARVEQIMGLLMELAPVIRAGQGAHQAWTGIERALSGLAEMTGGAAPRRAVRGRR
jgi:hypothetical protein